MMTPDELAPAFKGRPHLAALWQKISSGASEFTPEEQIQIMLAETRVFQTRGDFSLALEQGQKALALAQPLDYTNGVVAALANLAATHFSGNNYAQANQSAKQALARASDAPDSPQALNMLGLCAFDTDDWHNASSYFEQAIQLSRQMGQKYHLSMALHNLSLLYRDQGKFDLSLAALDEYQHLLVEMGISSDRQPMSRSWIHLITNNRQAARQALVELEPFALKSSLVAGVYYLFLSRLAMDEDDFERAETQLQRVRTIADATGHGKLNHWFRAAYSRLRRLEGDASGAMSWANEALEFAQRFTSRFEESVALVERARAFWMLEEFSASEKDFLAALNIAQKLGAEYLASEATFLLAALRRQQKSAESESTWLDAARRIKIGGYGFILERERALAFPLVAAQSRSRDAAVRAGAETMLEHLAKIAPLPLRVHGLGRFDVWQGRRKIPDREWQKRSAGELFRFLLLQPRYAAARGVIFESLCPDRSPEAAQNFLHLATSTLRRILEPDLPDKFPSRYLMVEGEQVELRLPSGSWIDFQEFEKESSASLEEPSSAGDERTLALYQGDLFPPDRYADWASVPRERSAELHRRALLALAQKKLDSDLPAALDVCRQILTSDPWREDAVLTAMKACLAMSDRPGALRLYRDLERHLQSDLQISPRKDLQDLAASLRN